MNSASKVTASVYWALASYTGDDLIRSDPIELKCSDWRNFADCGHLLTYLLTTVLKPFTGLTIGYRCAAAWSTRARNLSPVTLTCFFQQTDKSTELMINFHNRFYMGSNVGQVAMLRFSLIGTNWNNFGYLNWNTCNKILVKTTFQELRMMLFWNSLAIAVQIHCSRSQSYVLQKIINRHHSLLRHWQPNDTMHTIQ